MIRKVMVAVVVAVASSVLAFSTPAVAASNLETINPTGGTSPSDGLKVEVAFGQIQVNRDGHGQFFGPNDPPSPEDSERLSNYFVVAFDSVLTVRSHTFVGDSYDFGGQAWDSFTSEATYTDSDRSGVIINHLVSGSGTSLVALDVTVTYTYPNDYLNVRADLTLGSDWSSSPHKIYWYTDAFFDGSDAGPQFTGVNSSGQRLAGVTVPDHTAVQAFRQTAGQNLNWWAGQYSCPYTTAPATGDCDPSNLGRFAADYLDFPNAVSLIDNDNGFGISSPQASGNESINFDLVFTTCASTGSNLPVEVCPVTPALPDTGTPRPEGLIVSLTLIAAGVTFLGFRTLGPKPNRRRTWR